MEHMEHYQQPDSTQRAERETKKKEWEAHLYLQIQQLGRWRSRLRLALPSWAREIFDEQLQ